MPGPNTSIWSQKDVYDLLQNRLNDADIFSLRAVSKDCKLCVDGTLARLKPVNLGCRLLSNRKLPGLKSLYITQLQHLQPTQLQSVSSLTHLTHLHVGGAACSALRSNHLAWIGQLVNLQELSVTKCTKVRLRVLKHWHTLTQLQRLTLIGVSCTAADAHHLYSFLAAGAAASLTSLVLGDQQGLNFLSDKALEGVGQLLGPVGKLKVLDLSGCIELTDQGFQHLAGLSSLQCLQLPNCMKIASGAVQQVAKFSHLTTLNLRGCNQLHDSHLQQLLQHLTALKTLNLQACSSLTGSFLSRVDTVSRLVNLRTLNLAYCPGLYPSNLGFLGGLPVLEELDVTGGSAVSGVDSLLLLGKLQHVTKLVGGHWRCKAAGGSLSALVAGNSSSSSNADPAAAAAAAAGVECLPLLPPKLVQLVISHLSCSDVFLQALIDSLPKTLEHLDLSSCAVSGFGNESSCLKGLERCCNLRSLNLSGGSGKLDETVLACMNVLTGLIELKVDHICSNRSDTMRAAGLGEINNGLAALKGSSSSTSSTSSSCSSSSDGKVGDTITTSNCGAINAVAGSCCQTSQNSVSDGSSRTCADLIQGSTSHSSSSNNAGSTAPLGVAALLAGTASGLSKLELASRSNTSSRNGSTAMTGTAPVRRNLFPDAPVDSCLQNLGDQFKQQQQQPWLSCMQQLQHLSISFSTYITDAPLASLAGLTELASLELIACHGFSGSGFSSWTLLSGLTRLNLSGCSGLRDGGLVALADSCQGLKELSLAGCKEVTDEGVAALQQVTGLRQLNLASNRHISSRSMAALFPKLRHLTQLGLSLCSSICDDALQHLALAPGLAAADLRGCWRITDQGVRALLSSSPSLLQLDVDSCHRLSSDCCPQQFAMAGDESVNSYHGSPTSSSSSSSRHLRPGLLIRVATPHSSNTAAAAAAAAAADDDLVVARAGVEVVAAAEANMTCSMMSESSSSSSSNGSGSGSGSSCGCLELSALQEALDQQ